MDFMIPVLRYLSYFFLSLFSLHCLVSGLYLLAEYVEEHTKTTKKIMNYTLYFVLFLHVLLVLFGGDLPLLYLLFSLLCHLTYSPLLQTYPYIDIFSPLFLLCGTLAFSDHFLWFYHFANFYAEPEDVIAFFVCCVWLVPFSIFVSLSAGEDILPFTSSPEEGGRGEERKERGGGAEKKKSSNILLSIFKYVGKQKESLLPTQSSEKML